MTNASDYVLGQSDCAARRLDIQDAHLAKPSEQFLDDLALRPADRVVELGCGPGGLTRRILRRLGPAGVVVAVDSGEGLLAQAKAFLAGAGPGKFEPTAADVSQLGPWLDGADVVCGRAVLHHVPMAEVLVGRLRTRVRPGTRVGFIEPDFRGQVGHLAYLEATGRPELAPLRVWLTVMNELYLARRISPAVGATLGVVMEAAGYRNVRSTRVECPADEGVIENMAMCYDEIRGTIESLGILTAAQSEEQQRLLRKLPLESMPPVWGVFRVTAEA